MIWGDENNWHVDRDGVVGLKQGTVLHPRRLPPTCTLEFDAILHENNGSDELDVIVSNVMVLYYVGGVRIDTMTLTTHDRQALHRFDRIRGPQLGLTYHFLIHKKGDGCTLDIDGEHHLPFNCAQGENPGGVDSFGFHHFKNKVEYKNIHVRQF